MKFYILFNRRSLAELYPKLRTRFSLSGKNPGFLANTFSTSSIIDEVQKVKLPFDRGFSDRVRATTPKEYRYFKKNFSIFRFTTKRRAQI
ncbi:MAG: hypothetical protein ACYTXI_34690 [Nostoc sp.]